MDCHSQITIFNTITGLNDFVRERDYKKENRKNKCKYFKYNSWVKRIIYKPPTIIYCKYCYYHDKNWIYDW